MARSSNVANIALLVGLGLVTLICIAILLMFLRNRFRRGQSQSHREPVSEEEMPSKWRNFFKQSQAPPLEKQTTIVDVQREVLIRKSLASRHGSITSSPTNSATDDDIETEERQDMRTDWKEWEARIHHERSTSSESHPALGRSSNEPEDLTIHPALRQVSSSPGWRPLNALPRLPTLAAAKPATTGVTNGPSQFLLGREASGARYGPLAANDDKF
jgi:hypothetical protein